MNPENDLIEEDPPIPQGLAEIVDTFLSIAEGVKKDIERLQTFTVEIQNCSDVDGHNTSLQDDIEENVEELAISLHLCLENMRQSEWLMREINSFFIMAELQELHHMLETIKGDLEYE